MVKITFGTLDQAVNFWELNPQMKVYKPFSRLYNKDTSKDKDYSSRQMWTIFFMCHPDEDENIFYRMPDNEKRNMLSETFVPDIDWEDSDFLECLTAYPFECMSIVERTLAEEKSNLIKRNRLITNTEWTLDRTEYVGTKPIIIKGTASQLNTLMKDSITIYERYKQIEEMFNTEKEKGRAIGGKKVSKSEKGELW
jgi:hypothetical protein